MVVLPNARARLHPFRSDVLSLRRSYGRPGRQDRSGAVGGRDIVDHSCRRAQSPLDWHTIWRDGSRYPAGGRTFHLCALEQALVARLDGRFFIGFCLRAPGLNDNFNPDLQALRGHSDLLGTSHIAGDGGRDLARSPRPKMSGL